VRSLTTRLQANPQQGGRLDRSHHNQRQREVTRGRNVVDLAPSTHYSRDTQAHSEEFVKLYGSLLTVNSSIYPEPYVNPNEFLDRSVHRRSRESPVRRTTCGGRRRAATTDRHRQSTSHKRVEQRSCERSVSAGRGRWWPEGVRRGFDAGRREKKRGAPATARGRSLPRTPPPGPVCTAAGLQ
jgi:hypothetical protein